MLPKAYRPSVAETCGRLGISQSNYYYWMRHPLVVKAKRQLTKNYFNDDVPDVLMALKNEALAGNVRAAEIFLQYVDDWKEDEIRGSEREVVYTPDEVKVIVRKFKTKKI